MLWNPIVPGSGRGYPPVHREIHIQWATPNKRVTPTNRLYMHPCSTIQVDLIPPFTAQVAGHRRMQSHPARLCETSTTILAADHQLVGGFWDEGE